MHQLRADAVVDVLRDALALLRQQPLHGRRCGRVGAGLGADAVARQDDQAGADGQQREHEMLGVLVDVVGAVRQMAQEDEEQAEAADPRQRRLGRPARLGAPGLGHQHQQKRAVAEGPEQPRGVRHRRQGLVQQAQREGQRSDAGDQRLVQPRRGRRRRAVGRRQVAAQGRQRALLQSQRQRRPAGVHLREVLPMDDLAERVQADTGQPGRQRQRQQQRAPVAAPEVEPPEAACRHRLRGAGRVMLRIMGRHAWALAGRGARPRHARGAVGRHEGLRAFAWLAAPDLAQAEPSIA